MWPFRTEKNNFRIFIEKRQILRQNPGLQTKDYKFSGEKVLNLAK